MTWEQIKEIEKSEFGVIGHHSHSHDYLIDKEISGICFRYKKSR